MRRTFLALMVLFAIIALVTTGLHAGCPGIANPMLKDGWTQLRLGHVDNAHESFAEARKRCPRHPGALNGLGFVALRRGQPEEADRWFAETLEYASRDVDALVGAGTAAFQLGKMQRAYALLTKAQGIDPARTEPPELLAQIPPGAGPPPDRPPLVLPDTTVYPARAHGDRFEVRGPDGEWQPFYVKGVNLGAALPGKHPSEFPDSARYAGWLKEIAELGANTIRVYTIHPPDLYKAFRAYNLAHKDEPLWMIHGAWAELPPGDDYQHGAWQAGFFREMRNVVDLLHGRADIPPRAGHASGHYMVDVSQWVLGYVIGREWEPQSVKAYNRLRPAAGMWQGQYLSLAGGSPMDMWLARACDYMIEYEMEKYRAQRPIAYTNWPTLDPLTHPTEATSTEEVAIRRARGEHIDAMPANYEDDAVALDASLIEPTAKFPAGYFASYHIYPYSPDFLVLDPEYRKAGAEAGRSAYWAYLRDLKAHHAGEPLLVSEYGLSTSFGLAHQHGAGSHHGGLSEAAQARGVAEMTREIADAGAAGGIVFEWVDEWFKKSWITRDFAIPLERNRMWKNALDPEQSYGIVALEPTARVAGSTAAARDANWRALPALGADGAGVGIRAVADEQYLWLHVSGVELSKGEELLVGFDIADPAAGAFRWPGKVGAQLPVGIEFVLRANRDGARVLASPSANPFRVRELTDPSGRAITPFKLADAPAGAFQGRYSQDFNMTMGDAPRLEDGAFEPLRTLTNRRRFARDGKEFPAMGYDRGILPRGELPGGLWQIVGNDAVEVRVPWGLLNVTDPSRRTVLQAGRVKPRPRKPGEPAPEDDWLMIDAVEDIRMVAARKSASGAWSALPAGSEATAAAFTWETWEQPRWNARRRPLFASLKEAFATLDASTLTMSDKP